VALRNSLILRAAVHTVNNTMRRYRMKSKCIIQYNYNSKQRMIEFM